MVMLIYSFWEPKVCCGIREAIDFLIHLSLIRFIFALVSLTSLHTFRHDIIRFMAGSLKSLLWSRHTNIASL